MTADEFVTWKAKAMEVMDLSIRTAAFINDGWFRSLDRFSLDDGMKALQDAPADPRWRETMIRADKLPLILEYAKEAKAKRERKPIVRLGENPPSSPKWEAFLKGLKKGIVK